MQLWKLLLAFSKRITSSSMSIAIYARKSTESDDRQVQSLEDQLKALSAIAAREGLLVTKVYQESKSAKEPNARPEFGRLVSAVKSGRITGVLTWSMDRLSRNPVDGGVIAYLLQSGKLDFIRTAERRYDQDGNALLLAIENGMATAYLQDLSRNVRRGMKGKADRGWHPCKAPVGYLNDPVTREVVPDPQRFPLVRRAFDMVLADGCSLSTIHRHLVSTGLTVSSRHGNTGPISYARLHKLMGERFYTGKVVFKGRVTQGRHVPMLSETEYRVIQENLARRRWKSKKPVLSFPFRDVLSCSRCGCAIVGQRNFKTYPKTRGKVKYVYYHCTGARGCSKAGVTQDELWKKLLGLMSSVYIPEPCAQWLQDAVLQAVERESSASALDSSAIAEQLRRQEDRIERLTQMRLDDEISAEEFASLKSAETAKADSLREHLEQSRSRSERLVRMLRSRVHACQVAGELAGQERNLRAVGLAAQALGVKAVSLRPLVFELDPIIEKIAGFKPLRDDSEKPKLGDSLPQNSIWWALVRDLLTTATEMIDIDPCESGSARRVADESQEDCHSADI